jgi:hypothetical protein
MPPALRSARASAWRWQVSSEAAEALRWPLAEREPRAQQCSTAKLAAAAKDRGAAACWMAWQRQMEAKSMQESRSGRHSANEKQLASALQLPSGWLSAWRERYLMALQPGSEWLEPLSQPRCWTPLTSELASLEPPSRQQCWRE